MQEAVARRELTILKCGEPKIPPTRGHETLGSEGNARMLQASMMPYHRRAVEDGVSGRTGDLSRAALGLRKRKQIKNIVMN